MNVSSNGSATVDLQVATPETVKAALTVVTTETALVPREEVKSVIETKADQFLNQIMSIKPADINIQEDITRAVQSFGMKEREVAAKHNTALSAPLRKLQTGDDLSVKLAQDLVELHTYVAKVDPNKIDFSKSGFSKLLSFIPGFGDKIQRYLTEFMSVQETINAIAESLKLGRDRLERDNMMLREQMNVFRMDALTLADILSFGVVLKGKVEAIIESVKESEGDGSFKHKFLIDQILFPLNQNIMDIQERITISQHGVLTYGVIVENGRQLIRGVDRARTNTISALEMGATAAVVLHNQEEQLNKLEGVNKVTENLIEGTAARLKDQGARIQERAATSNLDMGAMQRAFKNTLEAIEAVSTFRMNAIASQNETIRTYTSMIDSGSSEIKKVEMGERAGEIMNILSLNATA